MRSWHGLGLVVFKTLLVERNAGIAIVITIVINKQTVHLPFKKVQPEDGSRRTSRNV